MSLVLSKKEIKKLADKDSTKGLTLIPLSLYSKGRYIKVSVAVARGKKVFEMAPNIEWGKGKAVRKMCEIFDINYDL